MKGLLIKDFRLMKNQKNFFLVIAAIAVLMMISAEEFSFVIGYIAAICSFFVLSTISYDEFDNGNAFLFTLPFTRKKYVREKYAFGLIVTGAAWLCAVLAALCDQLASGRSFDAGIWFASALLQLAVPLILLSLMIPVQLKFGQEKGPLAKMILFGALFALLFFFSSLFANTAGNDAGLLFWPKGSRAVSLYAAALGIPVVAVICLAFSFFLSVRIIEKKEF